MNINDIELLMEILFEGEVYQITNINYKTESIVLRNLETDRLISINFDNIEEYGEEI